MLWLAEMRRNDIIVPSLSALGLVVVFYYLVPFLLEAGAPKFLVDRPTDNVSI